MLIVDTSGSMEAPNTKIRAARKAAATACQLMPDGTWFVGIDERTAILGDGEQWEIFGRGGVDVRGPDRRETFEAGQRFTTPG